MNYKVKVSIELENGYIYTADQYLKDLLETIRLGRDIKLNEWMSDGIAYKGTGILKSVKFNRFSGDLEEVFISERTALNGRN